MVPESSYRGHTTHARVNRTSFASKEKKSRSMRWLGWVAVSVFFLFSQLRTLRQFYAYDSYYRSMYLDHTVEFSNEGNYVKTDTSQMVLNTATGRTTNETKISSMPKDINDNFVSPATNSLSRWSTAKVVNDGNRQIEFFDETRQKNKGIAACLINLEDTIRMAEWLPYHYATLPLGSVVIALDPNNSERGIQRTLELIDLWKDKIEITLWPEFFLPENKRFRQKQSYTRERQVYFANQCLAYHKEQNRTWTLLSDNDEYFIFNYVHEDESLKFDHPSASKNRIKNMIKKSRKKFMPLRKHLPAQNESTILDFIHHTEMDHRIQKSEEKKRKESDEARFFPSCIRMPGIRYGGDLGVNETLATNQIIEPRFLSTLRNIHHETRQSKFSKVMIDVSRANSSDFEWTESNHAKTIHNPSRVCGYNGASDSGADYFSSLFRLNHYLGSLESYLERATDYRPRSLETYQEKGRKIKPSESNWDTDIWSWVDVFVQSVGGATEAKKLLAPLVIYQEAFHQQSS